MFFFLFFAIFDEKEIQFYPWVTRRIENLLIIIIVVLHLVVNYCKRRLSNDDFIQHDNAQEKRQIYLVEQTGRLKVERIRMTLIFLNFEGEGETSYHNTIKSISLLR